MAGSDPRNDPGTRTRLARIQAGYERWQKITLRALIFAGVLWTLSTAALGYLYGQIQTERAQGRDLRIDATELVCELSRDVYGVAAKAEQAGQDEDFTRPLAENAADCERLLEQYRQSTAD